MGSWELLAESSEVPAIHAALLSNAQVVYFSGNEGPDAPAQARVWDPNARQVSAPPNVPETDLFCCGLTLLFDGRLFVMGGTGYYSTAFDDPWGGSKAAYRFEVDGGWERIDDMAFGRWYPSAICLADGRILVASGEGAKDVNSVRTEALETYNLFGGWDVLPPSANRHLPLYPRLFLLPNGEVLATGQGGGTAILNLEANQWREIAPPTGAPGSRDDDLCALLAPVQAARVLRAGGANGAASAEAWILDCADPAPAWRAIAPMHHPRWFPNSALLPDGKLFVVGGGRGRNSDPVMEPEIFDPETETWTEDAPMTVPRLYHSTALLLPDGRVWVAGTDGETRMELYSPDYLLGGPRPALWAAPERVAYSQGFPIPMPDAGDVAHVCFIRLSAVTHAFNTSQRYVPLDFAASGSEELQVIAPADPNAAPPGHYLLFIRNGAGVPAVAPIVELVLSG